MSEKVPTTAQTPGELPPAQKNQADGPQRAGSTPRSDPTQRMSLWQLALLGFAAGGPLGTQPDLSAISVMLEDGAASVVSAGEGSSNAKSSLERQSLLRSQPETAGKPDSFEKTKAPSASESVPKT